MIAAVAGLGDLRQMNKTTMPVGTPRESAVRIFGFAFLGALAMYVIAYFAIEKMRPGKGPWEVTFGIQTNTAMLTINQHRLGITNFSLLFPGQSPGFTNLPQTVLFNKARPVPFPLPFGECVFLDTTFLPGTVTLRMFGHELELLPRVLVLDHAERPWAAHAQIAVAP